MDGRPKDSYQVRSRVETRWSWRASLALVALAAIVALWAYATLTGPPPRVAEASPGLTPSDAPTRAAEATLPPDVERFPGMRSPVIPAIAFDGLAWLDTTRPDARLAMEPPGVAEWAFVWPDGNAVCICYDPTEPDPGPIRSLRWFGAPGEATGNQRLEGWPVPGHNRVVADVAWDPTAGAFYLAWAELTSDGWTVRLQLRDALGGVHATAVLDRHVFAEAAAASSVSIGLAVAPDGRTARVELDLAPVEAPAADTVRAWFVPIDGAAFGTPVPSVDAFHDDGPCSGAWATPDYYAELCGGHESLGGGTLIVRRAATDGGRDRLDVGAFANAQWILDQSRGRFFVWDAAADHLVRVDVAELAVAQRSVEASNAATFVPEAPWPSARAGTTTWAPRGAGRFDPAVYQQTPGVEVARLVGATAGDVVYAGGLEPGGPFGETSNGIWAFDAETLAIVGHWSPVADYDALAVTPDGTYVIAMGSAGPSEIEAFGNHGRTIAFHDAHTGVVGLILRNDVSGRTFMVPEPFP